MSGYDDASRVCRWKEKPSDPNLAEQLENLIPQMPRGNENLRGSLPGSRRGKRNLNSGDEAMSKRTVFTSLIVAGLLLSACLRGQTRVVDLESGQAYKVEHTSNYYWVDTKHDVIAGTNIPYKPTWDFREMVQTYK
jgi:hypothetical protein